MREIVDKYDKAKDFKLQLYSLLVEFELDITSISNYSDNDFTFMNFCKWIEKENYLKRRGYRDYVH